MGEGTAAVGTDRLRTRCERGDLGLFSEGFRKQRRYIGIYIGSRERRHDIYRAPNMVTSL